MSYFFFLMCTKKNPYFFYYLLFVNLLIYVDQRACEGLVSHQGWNLGPLQWKCSILISRPPIREFSDVILRS